MAVSTLLRLAEHEALQKLSLSGSILDLGGDTRSAYRSYIRGEHTITTVDVNEKAAPDIVHDLEKPLPLSDASYDHVLLINVLEHIYNYRQLLEESFRILRPGGTVTIIVPFLFPIHPSPKDFWRFSEDALRRECEQAGFNVTELHTLGGGVLSARYVLLDRLLPGILRMFFYHTVRHLVRMGDAGLTSLAKSLGKKYVPSDYALGYMVHAKK